jgi:hypothetical protein
MRKVISKKIVALVIIAMAIGASGLFIWLVDSACGP